MSEDSINERLAREMTHEAFSPPEDLGTAQAMIDMVAQEAFPAYGFARSGQDMMSSLSEGDLGWAALAGLGLLPGIPAVTAFHGTPHRFAPTEKSPLGEFDASRIGTGEGAQSYGHGFYFAENPEVAGSYADQLSDRTTGHMDAVNYWMGKAQGDKEKAIAMLKEHTGYNESGLWAIKPGLRKRVDETIKMFSSPTSNNLYTVDIPDEHVAKMLDWDKPLSEQPEHVRKTFESFGMLQLPDATGAEMYRLLGTDNPEDAAKRLRAAGIPGIRYLDQGSRATSGGEILGIFKDGKQFRAKIKVTSRGGVGFTDPTDSFTTSNPFKTEKEALEWAQSKVSQGTYNFVVFDPAIAKILERK